MCTVNVSYFICIIITIIYHDHTENIIINRFTLYNRILNNYYIYELFNCMTTELSVCH